MSKYYSCVCFGEGRVYQSSRVEGVLRNGQLPDCYRRSVSQNNYNCSTQKQANVAIFPPNFSSSH